MRPGGGARPVHVAYLPGRLQCPRPRGVRPVRIVYLSREAVRVNKAEEAGLGSVESASGPSGPSPEPVWGPLVDAETIRLEKIRTLIASGILPDRQAFDDKTNKAAFKPEPGVWPLCGYCAQRKHPLPDRRPRPHPHRTITVQDAMKRSALKPRSERAQDYLDELKGSRMAVTSRSRGNCECGMACGLRAEVVHHRLRRSAGGTNQMDNLVHLADACHRRVHENPAWAYENGLLLRRSR